jgi:hypothetical protein
VPFPRGWSTTRPCKQNGLGLTRVQLDEQDDDVEGGGKGCLEDGVPTLGEPEAERCSSSLGVVWQEERRYLPGGEKWNCGGYDQRRQGQQCLG